jgi:hypothetical protein
MCQMNTSAHAPQPSFVSLRVSARIVKAGIPCSSRELCQVEYPAVVIQVFPLSLYIDDVVQGLPLPVSPVCSILRLEFPASLLDSHTVSIRNLSTVSHKTPD